MNTEDEEARQTNEAVEALLKEEIWINGLESEFFYSRTHDDNDGDPEQGVLHVMIDRFRDVRVFITGSVLPKSDPIPIPMLRFRNSVGGGNSLKVRNALLILAEAIRRENKRPRE